MELLLLMVVLNVRYFDDVSRSHMPNGIPRFIRVIEGKGRLRLTGGKGMAKAK